MGGQVETKMLLKAINVTDQDIESFKFIVHHGVKVIAQMVPNDEPVDISTVL